MESRNVFSTVMLVFIMPFFFCSCSGGEPTNTEFRESPEVVVRNFYTDYLTAWSEPDVQSGLEHSQNAIEENGTSHLRNLNSNNDSGADYFTHVQEICPDWVSNISTKMLSKKNDSATVELTLGKDDSESTYHVNLVRGNNKWLMNSVEFESGNIYQGD